MDDLELLQRACKLDRDAIGQLYQEHVHAIYRYVYYRVGDAQAAEDLTAEVFLRAVESLPHYRPTGTPFRAWLYRIARARVADHYRRQKRARVLPLEEEWLSDEESPQHQAEKAQDVRRLAEAIRHLTGDQQQVLILKFVDRLSNAQVAQILGKTEGAVKSLQHRALRALERQMSQDDES